MISKGKFRNLRRVYKIAKLKKLFRERILSGYSRSLANGTVRTREALEKAIDELMADTNWETLAAVMENGDTVHRMKGKRYSTLHCGKHRSNNPQLVPLVDFENPDVAFSRYMDVVGSQTWPIQGKTIKLSTSRVLRDAETIKEFAAAAVTIPVIVGAEFDKHG